MVFGNIEHIDEFKWLEKSIYECLEYVKNHDMEQFDEGSYNPEGRLKMNINKYMTSSAEGRAFEAHRKYIDIHLILEGTERVDVAYTDKLDGEEYSEANDIQFLNGKANGTVIMEKGDFIVCYPNDAHLPAVAVDAKSEVKKAVFKVLAV